MSVILLTGLLIIAVILIVLSLILNTSEDSLDGVFTTRNITKSPTQSIGSAMSIGAALILIVVWLVIGIIFAMI